MCISKYIHAFVWYIVIHPCHSFNSGLTKPLKNLRRGWVFHPTVLCRCNYLSKPMLVRPLAVSKKAPGDHNHVYSVNDVPYTHRYSSVNQMNIIYLQPVDLSNYVSHCNDVNHTVPTYGHTNKSSMPSPLYMMTSSNENIFRVTGHLCGEFTSRRWIPTQRPVTRSYDVFFKLRLNKLLCKQWWGWLFETPSCPLWRHCNELSTPFVHSRHFLI